MINRMKLPDIKKMRENIDALVTSTRYITDEPQNKLKSGKRPGRDDVKNSGYSLSRRGSKPG